jgi:hypothetical protein
MPKVDIEELIATGSARKKVLFLMEHLGAVKYLGERRLTGEQFQALLESITEKEVKIYNKYRLIEEKVTRVTEFLSRDVLSLMGYTIMLRGYLNLIESYLSTEKIVNLILNQVPSNERRRDVLKRALKHWPEDDPDNTFYYLANAIPDKNGFLKIDLDSSLRRKGIPAGRHLSNVIYNTRIQTREIAIKNISYGQAILDYMKEEGFNVKTYKNRVKDLLSQVHESTDLWQIDFIKNTPEEREGINPLEAGYTAIKIEDPLEVDPKEYERYKSIIQNIK